MKCVNCDWYKNNVCVKATAGEISQIDDPICLMRCQISLLRSIWEELAIENNEGEGWKEQNS